MMVVNFWLFFGSWFSKLVFSYEKIMTDALNIINSKIGDFFAKLQNNSGL
jgi:hypothetical protein